jgi:hypothetical protein
MRLSAVIALLVCLISHGAFAQTAPEPLQLVRSFYATNFREESMPLSARLKDLLSRAQAKSKELDSPVAGLDFSWTMGAQDADDGWEKTLRLAVLKSDANRAQVQAKLRLFKKEPAREIHYLLEREQGRWVVGDIVYLGPDRYTLSDLLARGAKGED